MRNYLHSVRDRFHPVHHLRRFAPSRAILKVIDVPVWTKLPGVNWKVRARLVRHASTIILPGGAEPGISALFFALNRRLGISAFWDVGSNVGYYARATIESHRPILIFECFHGARQIANFLRQSEYWIGDADCMDNPLPTTTNFVALPKQHCTALTTLKKL